MFKKALVAGALGVGLATSVAAPANAAGPVFLDHFHDQFSDVDLFLSDLCGFEIEFRLDTHGTFRVFEDGRVHLTEHGTLTFSANGRTLTEFWAGSVKSLAATETIDEEAGTVTVEFDDTHMGVHERWVSDEGGVLIMDRGRAHIVGVAVFNLETGVLISFEQEFETSGPHPILELGGLDPAAACQFLS
jgi:hypothetical protein